MAPACNRLMTPRDRLDPDQRSGPPGAAQVDPTNHTVTLDQHLDQPVTCFTIEV
jgi:hypothetical protein